MSSWLKLLLYTAPIALVVYEQCKRLGLTPALPLAGLVVGVVAELLRDG